MPELSGGLDFAQIDQEILNYVVQLVIRLVGFSLGAMISPLVGKWFFRILLLLLVWVEHYLPFEPEEPYRALIQPYQVSLQLMGTFGFIALCLNLLVQYGDLYIFIGFFVYLALSVSLVWFASQLARKLIRRSVIILVQRWFGEVNEVVLIFETLIYVLIILTALIIFAVGLRVNLVALAASLGVGGVAIAFAAQQTLGRLFGTLELYLDRPYVSGEYIRVTLNPFAEDIYGRVEAIGLRSTKIRMVAQHTMMIVPNSLMASKNVENVSRGKKVMAMLCLDFTKRLHETEQALVKRTVEETSELFWGLERASTRIQFCPSEVSPGTRARTIFFITSSSQNSLGLRKRLLELANDAIAKKLAAYNLKFTVPEPTVYIDSKMTI
jgi:MscS family membrane protein